MLAVLLVVIVVGTLVWYFVILKNPSSQTTPGTNTKPTPGVGFGNLKPYAKLCKEFQKTNAKISCEKAIELALAQAPGKIQKISIGPVLTPMLSPSGSVERRTIDTWLIDIKVAHPYFDQTFKKEIHAMRFGIRSDKLAGVSRQRLE